MSEGADVDAVRAYYDLVDETRRLRNASGILEFERMKAIILRHLPPPPAAVADIGGGPGSYAMWLADLGYRVEHRDLIPAHVETLAGRIDGRLIHSAMADARDLDIDSESVDAVLLLGPVYHLAQRADRLRAIGEARRIARPGAPLFVAAVSRWSMRLHGVLHLKLYQQFPSVPDASRWAEVAERTGRIEPYEPGAFAGYGHRPGQFRSELGASGLEVLDLVAVDGPALILGDIRERMADPRARQVVLDALAALERVPEVLGFTHQMVATARRPRDT